MKTAQVLKITSAWSLLILEDRKLFIEAKVNHEAQCIRNLKLHRFFSVARSAELKRVET
jgi:hypothetical protein